MSFPRINLRSWEIKIDKSKNIYVSSLDPNFKKRKTDEGAQESLTKSSKNPTMPITANACAMNATIAPKLG